MFRDNIENAKIDLQGRVFKSFLVILRSCLSFLIFLLSSFSCIYFLVVNTQFLGGIGVFDNQYIHALVCGFAVIENMILFHLHIYAKLKKDVYFYCFDESADDHISVSDVLRSSCVYILKSVKKAVWLLFFCCPFLVVLGIIINLLQSGMSYSLLIIFIICASVLLISGIYSYFVYIQKYELLPLLFMKNRDKSIREIFKLSEKMMNGKCKKLLKLKFCNLPKKLSCLFIIPAVYVLPYCKTVNADFILQNEKPYMRRKAYTEKPIVFYFKPMKEH